MANIWVSLPGVGREVGLREASGTCPSCPPALLWKAAALCPPMKVLVFPERTGTLCPPAVNNGIGATVSALDVTAICATAR